MASSASPYNRLRGIFNKPITRTQTAQNSITKISKPSDPPSTQTQITTTKNQKRLQNLVERCKQLSKQSPFRTRYANYETLVLRLASAKQFSMIEDVVDHLKNYSEITDERFAIRLITLYGKAGMFDHAQKVFDQMPDLNCKRTVMSINALLSTCINSKKFDKFDELLNNLPVELSIDPNVVTYNIAIKALCEMKSFDDALSVLDKMEMKGIEPDLITYNTLLDGFYMNERFSDGEMIWTMIENKNLVHSIVSYNLRLRGLVFEGRVLEAVKFFDEIENKGLAPDVLSYSAIIKGFCNEGNLVEAKKWYELLKSKTNPDGYTFSMLLRSLCENGDFDMGFEICKEIIKTRRTVGVSLFQRVVDGLVKESKKEEAMELVKLARCNDHHCYKVEYPSDK